MNFLLIDKKGLSFWNELFLEIDNKIDETFAYLTSC